MKKETTETERAHSLLFKTPKFFENGQILKKLQRKMCMTLMMKIENGEIKRCMMYLCRQHAKGIHVIA